MMKLFLLEIRFFFHCGLVIFSDGDEALVGTTSFKNEFQGTFTDGIISGRPELVEKITKKRLLERTIELQDICPPLFESGSIGQSIFCFSTSREV
jgi:hypothetical protein